MGSSLAASCAAMAALVRRARAVLPLSRLRAQEWSVHVRCRRSVGYLLPRLQLHPQRRLYARCEYPRATPPGFRWRSMDDAIALPENRNIKLVARDTSPLAISAWRRRSAYSRLRCAVSFLPYDWIGTRDCASWFERCWNESARFATTSAMNVQQLASYASFIPKNFFLRAMCSFAGTGGILRPVQQEFGEAFKAAGTTVTAPLYSWDAALIVVSGLRRLARTRLLRNLRAYIEQLHDLSGRQRHLRLPHWRSARPYRLVGRGVALGPKLRIGFR